MPSGREIHTPKRYEIPNLPAEVVARMRAPPDPSELARQATGDDSDNEGVQSDPVGAFPGTKGEYSSSSTYY